MLTINLCLDRENPREHITENETKPEKTEPYGAFAAAVVKSEAISTGPEKADFNPEIIAEPHEIDDPEINLLLDLGFEEEVRQTLGKDRIFEFVEKEEKSALSFSSDIYGFIGEEFESASQNEKIEKAYRKDIKLLSLRAGVCAFFTLVLLMHELMPQLGNYLGGVFDYETYPLAYLLIGLQFFMYVFVAGFGIIKKGAKNLISSKPDVFSFIALAALFNIIFNLIQAFGVTPRDIAVKPANTLAAFLILAAAVTELLVCVSEREEFRIASSDMRKFTLATDPEENPVIEKMYAGGLPRNPFAGLPREVTFPKGYFRLRREKSDGKTGLGLLLYISLAAGIALGILRSASGGAFSDAAYAFYIFFACGLPLPLLAATYFPRLFLSFRQTSRGNALIGEKSFERFEGCGTVVFRDLHLFKPISPKNAGIVLINGDDALLMFRSLDSLFEKLGGPCRGVFSEAADREHPVPVKIRHIAQNGAEALVYGKISLIIGEEAYLARHGIYFPDEGKKHTPAGTGTLYVGFGGIAAAKIMLKFNTVPIFETLVEKLAKEGIIVAVETF